jgi:hypothetical protein
MNVVDASYSACRRAESSPSETRGLHALCSPTYPTTSIPSEITQHFLDNQWAEHYQELFHLAYHKLLPYLSQHEQEALCSKLYGVGYEAMAGHTPMMANTMESGMQRIYEKFGVDNFYHMIRYAVFTSEEEIKLYVES